GNWCATVVSPHHGKPKQTIVASRVQSVKPWGHSYSGDDNFHETTTTPAAIDHESVTTGCPSRHLAIDGRCPRTFHTRPRRADASRDRAPIATRSFEQEPLIGAKVVVAAEEAAHELGGIAAAAGRQHLVAVGVGHLGRHQA